LGLPRERVRRSRRESQLASGREATVAACLLQLCQGQHQAQSTILRIAPFYSPLLFQHPDFGRSPNRPRRRSRLHEDQPVWPVVRRKRQRCRRPRG
jgi:hypothetical protein